MKVAISEGGNITSFLIKECRIVPQVSDLFFADCYWEFIQKWQLGIEVCD